MITNPSAMTSDQQFWIAMVTLVISAVSPILMLLINNQVRHVANKVEEVHKTTNSMKDELVSATARASHSEGKLEGLAEGLNDIHTEIKNSNAR